MRWCFPVMIFSIVATLSPVAAFADGKLQKPRNYSGSLEERSQEAIIVFREKTESEPAWQDLILKIRIGDEAPENFAWIIPFPNPPKATKAEKIYFEEVFQLVQSLGREVMRLPKGGGGLAIRSADDGGVKVISRETVGSYDITVVREEQQGKLNGWLEANGFEPMIGGKRVIEAYRKRGFVFACIKVTGAKLAPGIEQEGLDLHPLSFRFPTGGSDAAFFPMVLTGLQADPFDVTLYVFGHAVLNEDQNSYGFQQYGFRSDFQVESPNGWRPGGGSNYSRPGSDPILRRHAKSFPQLQQWFAKNHLGRRFYLTKLSAKDLDPHKIRLRDNDLWLFPAYGSRAIPKDAREGGPAFSRWHR